MEIVRFPFINILLHFVYFTVKKKTIMKIYPNPSRSTSYISIPEELVSECNLIVTNNHGEKIHEQSYSNVHTSLIALDMSKHPSGLYKVTVGNDVRNESRDLLLITTQN